MKKFLFTIILILFWCNATYGSDQEIIDKYLSERKLDTAEGLWKTGKGKTFIIYQLNNEYFMVDDTSKRCGEKIKIIKESIRIYKYSIYGIENTSSCNRTKDLLNLKLIFSDDSGEIAVNVNGKYQNTLQFSRVWPENLTSHNDSFLTVSEIKSALSNIIKKVKSTCEVLGYKSNTNEFNECALKLYTQKTEEEANKRNFSNITQKLNELLIQLQGK